MDTLGADKVRENRLRRMATRQGLALLKNRRRDPRAIDYGRYLLTRDGVQVFDAKGMDEVEEFLTRD